ncbi:selenide, water dikinase [Lactobacillus sp. S2-2]|uniref:septation ring formation regulator EzrA n=1 Tax=Lactobacillus sp. S2-2 TaxID=2692917 RepID=UPI001F2EFC6F|nr:septation ring formation regulator EzrA [Lactobacillus sp. S2-2]MCF6515785.1 selenide, water dikinase [Lactobacillus sp. S2-2]
MGLQMVLRLIIGIIIISGLFYLAIAFYQRKSLTKIVHKENEEKDFLKSPIEDLLTKVGVLDLTGNSLKLFKDNQKMYETILNDDFPDVDKYVLDLQNNLKGVNFVKSKELSENALDKLNIIQEKIDNMNSDLQDIIDLDGQHEHVISQLEKKYKSLRAILLNNNADFGGSIDKLESKLNEIENNFDKFSNFVDNGDHQSAEEILTDVKADTKKLEEDISSIPTIYKNMKTEYPSQFKELKYALGSLLNSGINFQNSNISEEIDSLEKKLNDNFLNLNNLDLSLVNKNNNYIEEKIDGLYDEFESEYLARQYVEKNQKMVFDFIKHANSQSDELLTKLNKLNHNYSLEHDEMNLSEKMNQDISDIKISYNHNIDLINNEKAVYSMIKEDFLSFIKDLTEIEKKQKNINDSVSDLSEEEEKVSKKLFDLDLEMHSIERKIDVLNLPGISNGYLEFFDLVSSEIMKLNKTMKKQKISMDEVKKQIKKIESDRDILNEKTKELIDSAVLAERSMQYANRYKAFDEDINVSLAQSKKLFENDYKYKESLDVIAEAINKANPGSYQKIEDEYFKQES